MAKYDNDRVHFIMLYRDKFFQSTPYRTFKNFCIAKGNATACWNYLDLIDFTMETIGVIQLRREVFNTIEEQLAAMLNRGLSEIKADFALMEAAGVIEQKRKDRSEFRLNVWKYIDSKAKGAIKKQTQRQNREEPSEVEAPITADRIPF